MALDSVFHQTWATAFHLIPTGHGPAHHRPKILRFIDRGVYDELGNLVGPTICPPLLGRCSTAPPIGGRRAYGGRLQRNEGRLFKGSTVRCTYHDRDCRSLEAKGMQSSASQAAPAALVQGGFIEPACCGPKLTRALALGHFELRLCKGTS
jgi:hypothetical protein